MLVKEVLVEIWITNSLASHGLISSLVASISFVREVQKKRLDVVFGLSRLGLVIVRGVVELGNVDDLFGTTLGVVSCVTTDWRDGSSCSDRMVGLLCFDDVLSHLDIWNITIFVLFDHS